MSVPVRSRKFHDPMADSRHRRLWLRRSLMAVGALASVSCLVWVFFFSSFFDVTSIRVSGAQSIGDGNISNAVQELLNQKKLYIFQPLKNILLLNSNAVIEHLRGQFAVIGNLTVTKDYPHGLSISVVERKSAGQWCRLAGQGGGSCQLFDRDGVRWGSTLPSIGPLLLLVDDQRESDVPNAKMFSGMMSAVAGLPKLGLSAQKVILPDAEPGGIRVVTTKKYELYFDALGDVDDQLSVLAVFLADRAKDSSFSPQYIDLRTPGRVYFK